MVVGLIGFINSLTGYLIHQSYGFGYGEILFIYLFGGTVAVPFVMILQFWFIWLLAALFLKPKKKNIVSN